jgi:hypothetical protein
VHNNSKKHSLSHQVPLPGEREWVTTKQNQKTKRKHTIQFTGVKTMYILNKLLLLAKEIFL